MPYYKWRAIDLNANESSGCDPAHSLSELSKKLLRRDKGLMGATKQPVGSILFSLAPFKIEQFLEQLAATVASGISLNEAFAIFARTETDSSLKKLIHDILEQLQEGQSLSKAFGSYPEFFDPIMCVLLHTGESCGKIVVSLQLLVKHVKVRQALFSKIKTILTPVAITAAFLVAVCVVLVFFIAPAFQSFFTALQAPLPGVLNLLLLVRQLFFDARFWLSFILLAVVISWLIAEYKNALFQRVIVKLPVIGTFYSFACIGEFLRSVALMLDAGVSLGEAVQLIAQSAFFSYTRSISYQMLVHLQSGHSFFQAFERTCPANVQLAALIKSGELSGKFISMLKAVYDLHDAQLVAYCERLVVFLQPLLILFFGCIVASILFALYVPIISLSTALG